MQQNEMLAQRVRKDIAIAASRLCDCFTSFHYVRNDKICFSKFEMLQFCREQGTGNRKQKV